MTNKYFASELRRLLLVAFHFPPIQGSTGVTRTLAFAKYLREHGWEVTVLTAHPRAYPEIRIENLETIPNYVNVIRGFALDARRHLSIAGRFPLSLATPDRWQSWILGGWLAGKRIIKQWKPTAIMSTYPIASAHRLGFLLHRWSRLPWVADFRDPMVQEGYPEEPQLYKAYERIENEVFLHASKILVTAEGTAELYRNRFPSLANEKIVVVPNGFDEELFPKIDRPPPIARVKRKVLLHSGVLYPSERDPTQLFHAIAELRDSGALNPEDVEFRLRATGFDNTYAPIIRDLKIDHFVTLLPPIPYRDALKEMGAVDGCLVLQARNCNYQIPAKVYEYLYCGSPILGLTDPSSDTGLLLREFGIRHIAPLDDRGQIKNELLSFLEAITARTITTPSRQQILKYSRRTLTEKLATALSAAAAMSTQ